MPELWSAYVLSLAHGQKEPCVYETWAVAGFEQLSSSNLEQAWARPLLMEDLLQFSLQSGSPWTT